MTARKKASKKRARKVERQHPIMLQVMVDQALLDAIDQERELPIVLSDGAVMSEGISRAQMVRTLLRAGLRARGVPC